uniref:Uncharacterized protein n=1 Tax=Anguilla anguilla TaxID=7936 RepID=A0A0E9WDY4_ANGAN
MQVFGWNSSEHILFSMLWAPEPQEGRKIAGHYFLSIYIKGFSLFHTRYDIFQKI